MKEKKQEVTIKEEDFEPVEDIYVCGLVDVIISFAERNDKHVHVKTSIHKDTRGDITFIRNDGTLGILSSVKPQGSSIKISNSTIAQVSTGSGNIQIMNIAGKRQNNGKSNHVQIICTDNEAGNIIIDGNNIKESPRPKMEITAPKGTAIDSSCLWGNISYK